MNEITREAFERTREVLSKDSRLEMPPVPPLLVGPKDPILRTPCAPVVDIDAEVLPHVDGMIEILGMARGAGLAAPQIGVSKRFFLARIGVGSKPFAVVVNPVIKTKFPGRTSRSEGCLSFPGRAAFVARHDSIFATWLDHRGKTIERTLSGIEARVFQHEADHLDGIVLFS